MEPFALIPFSYCRPQFFHQSHHKGPLQNHLALLDLSLVPENFHEFVLNLCDKATSLRTQETNQKKRPPSQTDK